MRRKSKKPPIVSEEATELAELLKLIAMVNAVGAQNCTAIATEQSDGTFTLGIIFSTAKVMMRIKHHARPRKFTTIKPLLRCLRLMGFREAKIEIA